MSDCQNNFKSRRKSKKCNQPITSYGLLLFSYENETPVFLLYQRRDTFEYMDFLRGIWNSESQFPVLFSLMSYEERKRIREYTFQELWDDLWVDKHGHIYQDGYPKAKKKYDSIRDRIPFLLDTISSYICEPPWGFPKGKKNGYYEIPINCALREFNEETKLSTDSIIIIKPDPFIEQFKGSNGKTYATHYFLAEMPKPLKSQSCPTPRCIRKQTISEEASKVEWFKVDEACSHLNERRQSILRSALEMIQTKPLKE
uniref:NUDIX hydrolase n=1 Tax=Marseillevirus LCMAC102 TaxID=2506603 RepID=A0A481YVP1_9VIRU|nr:MAG: NUDIX hydrolase [Marseillevirus LCMAC102]